jgi:hypothetical protein
VRGRLLWGSCVAAETPAEGHHLRRLVPGTGGRCGCPCLEQHARPYGNRAVPNLPFPATGGTCAGFGGSAPNHAPGPSPDRNPALRKGIRTGATGSRAPDLRRPGSTMASNSGELHRVQASAPVWREYPSRAAPCGRLGRPVTLATGRIPPKGPKGRQHRYRQPTALTRATALCWRWCPTWDAVPDCLAPTFRTSERGQRFTRRPPCRFSVRRERGRVRQQAATKRRSRAPAASAGDAPAAATPGGHGGWI